MTDNAEFEDKIATNVFSRTESYAQWVRRTVARFAGEGHLIPLFDSSVPEPRAMLADIVTRAFAEPVDRRYASAFAGGNPYVVDHLCARYGVPPDHILCTTGATRALTLLYRGLTTPTSRVLVETPGFDLFVELAEAQQIAVDTFPLSPGTFAVDVAAVEAALRPGTRLVVLSNLHNPSGVLVPTDVLLALARLAEVRDLIVLVDEVYRDYVDRAERPPHAAALSPRLVSIGSLTKIYGLGTLRCGWIVADPAVLAPVRQLAERLEFGISNLAHAAAAVVLDEAERFDDWSGAIVARARPVAAAYFDRWRTRGLIDGAVPRYGCTAFPRLIGIDDTAGFTERLARRTGVIVAPGEYFGAPGHIRIGFARDVDELRTGLDRLEEALETDRRAMLDTTA